MSKHALSKFIVTLAAVLTMLLTLIGSGPASAQTRFDFAAAPGALPKDVVPSRYVLHWPLIAGTLSVGVWLASRVGRVP